MIVPQYWAEGRVQHRQGKRQVTVRRFGWSDESQEEAQRNADQRAQEALNLVLSGEKLARREPRIPYNGAAGVPIREEIVARHGQTIITRNAYGARCLNTPDVLFADIDFPVPQDIARAATTALVLLLLLGLVLWLLGYPIAGAISFVLGVAIEIVSATLANMRKRRAPKPDPEGDARVRISQFVSLHPDWNLRVYRTPAGMRVLATHRRFQPDDPAVVDCFNDLDADPVYVRMCLNQRCFRARVSPKPWRIGITDHLRPRPGVWPVSAYGMPLRTAWISEYEDAAQSFSACRFVESVGSGIVDPEARRVMELHDELCRAQSQLPMA
jgi:hypothetical protein